MKRALNRWCLEFCVPMLLGLLGSRTLADETSFFREQVEPVLKRRCYACHSHAARELEGGLALDWRSGWEKGGGRGPAIMPGDPDRSLLIRAVRHDDADLKMPDDRLPASELEILTRWVREGAIDPRVASPPVVGADPSANEWWSLKPLARPVVPAGSAANPIDAWIHDQLAKRGMPGPVELADRRTLIRRLTIDLHGLLPTPEAVDAFVNDTRPNAWELLVDQLLESPRHGERWARHWMDTIHFADSHGFEHDVFRPNAYRYRDYLIQSFHRDTPWPRFIREQLAADVLFPRETELTAALGFLGAGTYDHSAAVTAPKSFENLDRDDLVTQTMAAFASTTANCARCHEHKFDPITQEDYYSLQAVFAGIGKGDIPFETDPEVAARRTRWQSLQDACDHRRAEVLLAADNQQLVANWERDRVGSASWEPLTLDSFVSVDAATLQRLEDGSILSTAGLPEKETTSVSAATSLPKVTAIRLDVLPHESLPNRGPGRAENGNLHLNEIEIRAFRLGTKEGERLAIRRATADFDQEGWTIQHAIDGNLATAWGIHPQVGQPHFAVFELEQPLAIEPGLRLHILLRQIHGRFHILGRFRLSATDSPPELALALPSAAQEALAIPAAQRSPEQQLTLAAAVLKRVAAAELRKLPPPDKVYAAAAVATNERGVVRIDAPREIRVLKRGDVEQPGEIVRPGALSAIRSLPPRFDLPAGHPESARRAALADWLASPDNPLTWRSIANRVWHFHFGRGLCDTPSDFGRMGGAVSHPELLDWLACEVRDHGGSLKHLHRLICASETWRRSSAASAEWLALDPDNRLLARASRQRLDADCYRDAILQVSGRLDLTMGGPGVSHFSTRPGAQLTPILDYSQFNWDSPGATRRSIYRVVWRGIPDPLLEPLDFPDLGLLAPTRGFSASPLQALTLLNNRFVLHHVQQMASRAKRATSDPSEQVRHVTRWAWQRLPSDTESAAFVTLANKHGLEAVCRLLLNSNEFLFLD